MSGSTSVLLAKNCAVLQPIALYGTKCQTLSSNVLDPQNYSKLPKNQFKYWKMASYMLKPLYIVWASALMLAASISKL